MAPETSSKVKRRPNNERSTLAEVKHFLCYFCGDFFPNSLEYQKHIMNHQLFSFSYQVWNAKQEKNRRRSRLVEKSQEPADSTAQAQSSTDNQHQSEQSSSSLSNKRNSEVDEADFPKTVKRRKTVSKEEKSLAADESFTEGKKKESKTGNARKKESGTKKDTNANRIRSLFELNSTRSCDMCSYTCDKFSNLIAHQVEVHQASFVRVTMYLFIGDNMHAKKISPPGTCCPRCELKFINDSQYYIHLLSDHVPDIAYQLKEKYGDVNNQDTEVLLTRPNKPDIAFSYNYKMI